MTLHRGKNVDLTPQQKAKRLLKDSWGLVTNIGGQSMRAYRAYADFRRYLRSARKHGKGRAKTEDFAGSDVQAMRHQLKFYHQAKGPVTNIDLRYVFFGYAFAAVYLSCHFYRALYLADEQETESEGVLSQRRDLPGDYEEPVRGTTYVQPPIKTLPQRGTSPF